MHFEPEWSDHDQWSSSRRRQARRAVTRDPFKLKCTQQHLIARNNFRSSLPSVRYMHLADTGRHKEKSWTGSARAIETSFSLSLYLYLGDRLRIALSSCPLSMSVLPIGSIITGAPLMQLSAICCLCREKERQQRDLHHCREPTKFIRRTDSRLTVTCLWYICRFFCLLQSFSAENGCRMLSIMMRVASLRFASSLHSALLLLRLMM